MADRDRIARLCMAALATALGLIVVAVYWPGLGGAWVFDDFSNIVDNTSLRVTWSSSWEQWRDAALSSPSRDLPRPLAMLSFAANHALHGLDPFAMKLTNVLIHALNAALVYGMVRALMQMPALRSVPDRSRKAVALWAAAAWALNPINLMAVLFVVQRMESLSHTFVFAGLWIYLDGRLRVHDTGRGWLRMMVGIVGGTGLGVLVKESALLLPLYAGLVEWLLVDGAGRVGERRKLRVAFTIVLGLPALLAMARWFPRVFDPAAFTGRDFTLIERLLTEMRVLVDYIHWTWVPDLGRMSLYHDAYPISRGLLTPPSTLLSLVLLVALAGLAWALRRRRPLAALGIAWFFAAHALTATVWPLELVFEHRNYFASLGLCLLLADLLIALPQRPAARALGLGLGLVVLVFHAGATHLRAREWSDQLRFSSSEASKHPESPRATYDLARNLIILSDFRIESPYFKPATEALDRAMQVPGSTALPESAAILLATRSGTPVQEAWWRSLQHKLRTRPTGLAEVGALATLSDCVVERNCTLPAEEMVQSFLAALERGPHPRVLHDYGIYAARVLDDQALALTLLGDAVKEAPDEVIYRISLSQLLIALHRGDEAVAHIDHIQHLGSLGRYDAIAQDLLSQAGRSSSRARDNTATP
jgi:hypothetical protein